MSSPSPLTSINLDGSALTFVVDNIADTVIQPSHLHGYGLFAVHGFKAGHTMAQLDGQVVTRDSFDTLQKTNCYGMNNDDLFMEWNALSPDTLLIRPFRTKYSFINHSRTPNLMCVGNPPRLVTASAIGAHAELTLDYRKEPLSQTYLQKASYL